MGKLKEFFSHLFGTLKAEEETAIEAFEAKIKPDVIALAKDAIAEAAALGLGGDEAKAAALAKLEADAKTTGVDIATFAKNELNALIELVYVAVKPAAPAEAEQPGAGEAGAGEGEQQQQ